MKVKAKKVGFYIKLRKVGEQFDLTHRLSGGSESEREKDINAQFSETWMEKVEDQPVKKTTSPRRKNKNRG